MINGLMSGTLTKWNGNQVIHIWSVCLISGSLIKRNWNLGIWSMGLISGTSIKCYGNFYLLSVTLHVESRDKWSVAKCVIERDLSSRGSILHPRRRVTVPKCTGSAEQHPFTVVWLLWLSSKPSGLNVVSAIAGKPMERTPLPIMKTWGCLSSCVSAWQAWLSSKDRTWQTCLLAWCHARHSRAWGQVSLSHKFICVFICACMKK